MIIKLSTIFFCAFLITANHNHASSEKFTHPLDLLDQTIPSFLDLKINKLDLYLQSHRSFERQPEVSKLAMGIFEEIWYSECQYDKEQKKIIFTVHLGSPLSTKCRYWITRDEYAKELFNTLIIMAKKHIHEGLTNQDVTLYCMGHNEESWAENKNNKEILIFKWENGLLIYDDTFFK